MSIHADGFESVSKATLFKYWQDGLRLTKPTDKKILLNTDIWQTENPHTKLGEIDIIIKINSKVIVSELFPSPHVIRPADDYSSANTYFGMMRSEVKSIEHEIMQFVNFYYKFFKNNLIDRYKLTKTTRAARNDTSSILLFLFNGYDYVKAERIMRNTIKSICGHNELHITGHRVKLVWIHYGTLLLWKNNIVIEELDLKFMRADEKIKEKIEKIQLVDEKIKEKIEKIQLADEKIKENIEKIQLLEEKIIISKRLQAEGNVKEINSNDQLLVPVAVEVSTGVVVSTMKKQRLD